MSTWVPWHILEVRSVFREAGTKLASWRDVIWWQLSLREGPEVPDPSKEIVAIRGTGGWEAALEAGVRLGQV